VKIQRRKAFEKVIYRIQWKLRHTDEWQLLLQPRHSAIHGCDTADIKPLYSSSIQIKQDKYRDLQSLKSVIMS